jgi:hypothetical protein
MPDLRHAGVPSLDGAGEWVERILRWLVGRRLEAPAAMILEMHRPLVPLAWPAAVLVGGLVAPFVGPDYYDKIEVLRDPAILDRLLKRLESAGRTGGAESGE